MKPPARPLYFRLLRVRHLRTGPVGLFALFEGSIALALLLYLAGIVNEWGLLAIPLAVAVMVKLNDAVAAALIRPMALAQLRTLRPSEEPAVGRSPAPGPTYPTRAIDLDDDTTTWATTQPPHPGRFRVARGVARVPDENLATGSRRPDPPTPSADAGPKNTSGPERADHTKPVPDPGIERNRRNQGRFLP